MQQFRKLFLRGHHPNGIGRDRDRIVRIIGSFRVQGGLHWALHTQSKYYPHRGGRRIYAGGDDVLRHNFIRV